ncbi:MAG: hypothetical protein ACOVLB_07695 [Candidatus Nanopelagicus sp.]
MRATEFINEAKHRAKMTKRQNQATVGVDLFRDPDAYDRIYELNRMMMAVACADGSSTPLDIPSESWIGKDNSALPYTKKEQEMLQQAAKAIGVTLNDVNHGDLRSMELDDTNKSSPVQAFKGFGK